MDPLVAMKPFLLLGTIFSMLLLGLFVSARSGVTTLAHPRGMKQLASNLSQVVLLLSGCLLLLAVLQQLVGYHTSLLW
jgi:hypothetical protein